MEHLEHCSSMGHTLINIAIDNLYMFFVIAAVSFSSLHLPCSGLICKLLLSWKSLSGCYLLLKFLAGSQCLQRAHSERQSKVLEYSRSDYWVGDKERIAVYW